ncbi:flagellar assembly protein FliW [Sulfurospirillum arcachonense]|uniref:flagellar assembly protein FliW n=1 Tax=Sulfurospirillum arcachonense TaxID=57666 RepID=UPI00046A0295|nr:flagellar assembly protein FliW [Sulfurospirillum arcachonense]
MIFDVKTPIPGFDQIKKVELEKIDDFFMRLKSCDDDTVFMLINPFLLRDYDFEVPEYFKNILELEEDSNTLVLNIMIVSTPIENSVVNFIAPLIFNTDNKSVSQVLLDTAKYRQYGIMENISEYLGE